MLRTVTRIAPQVALFTRGQNDHLPHIIQDEDLPGLDPEWRTMWNEYGSHLERADEVTLEEYRKDPSKYSFTYPTYPGESSMTQSIKGRHETDFDYLHDVGPDVFHVEDYEVSVTQPEGKITVRVYSPEGEGPFPVHLNFHGGGWVLGGLNSEAAWCRHVCNDAKIKVIDVDYRMGPEFKYPTATYDCWDAVKWTIFNAGILNIDPTSVSFGGLSSGGQISAVLAHFARDEGIPIKLHLMIVPATDMRYCSLSLNTLTPQNCPYESARMLQSLPWSPLAREQWFLRYWLGADTEEQDGILENDWRMTPVLAPNFKGLPAAHIVTAEFDIERDEGEHYGAILREAGNKVTMKRYAGVPHAFAHYNHPQRGLAKSHEFIKDTSRILREVHSA